MEKIKHRKANIILKNLDYLFNSNTFNEQDVADVIIEEILQVEFSIHQIYVPDKT